MGFAALSIRTHDPHQLKRNLSLDGTDSLRRDGGIFLKENRYLGIKMKRQKKKEKPESEKKFSPKKDDFDDLSKKASTGDIKSMMLFLAKHGNRGCEMNELKRAELLKNLEG